MTADLHLVGADYPGRRRPRDLRHLEAEAMETVATAMREAATPLLEADPDNGIGSDLRGWATRLDFAARARRVVGR